MKIKHHAKTVALLLPLVLFPATAHATQGHSGIEGIYVHELGHVFFIFSMLMFIYWIQKSRLPGAGAWKYIQRSAVFFIVWSSDAFFVHLMHVIGHPGALGRGDWCTMGVSPVSDTAWVNAIYYLAKMDHLLCVPAIIFLYMGLKRLLNGEPQ